MSGNDLKDSEVLDVIVEHLTPETLVKGWGDDGSDAGCILHHVAKGANLTLNLWPGDKERQVALHRPGVVNALAKAMTEYTGELVAGYHGIYQLNDSTNYDVMIQITKNAAGIARAQEEGS